MNSTSFRAVYALNSCQSETTTNQLNVSNRDTRKKSHDLKQATGISFKKKFPGDSFLE